MEALGANAYPSTVYIFWPEEGIPLLDEPRFRVSEEAEPDEEPDQDHDTYWFWSQMFRLYEVDCPVLVWACRRSEGLMLGADTIRWRDPTERQRAEEATWLIGVETLLDPQNPLESYHAQLRFSLLLCPDCPALYDASSLRLRSGSEVERLAQSETPPRMAELFSTHVVSPRVPDQGSWLHTHGLRRASCPDIDLLAVPDGSSRAGGHLISGVAEFFSVGGRPKAGQRFEVGYQLEVAWQPWKALVKSRPTLLGGLRDRRGDGNDHGGERIVVVAPGTKADADPLEAAPLQALKALDRTHGVLFLSRRETERMTRLARERWSVFGMLYARHRDQGDGWTFLAKLGYDSQQAAMEYLWFEVREVKPNRLRAVLLNKPLHFDGMVDGSEDWHPLDRLTDWAILSPLGLFDPETADYLWDAAR